MNKLKDIFSKVLNLPQEQITDGLSPDNCPDWDSLNAIVLVTEIEKAYGIRFSFDEAMGVKNFGDAIKLVGSKGVDLNA